MATADLSPRIAQATLLAAALGIGVVSAVDPRFAIAAAIAIAFILLVFGNARAGLYLFTIVAFLDVLPAFGGPLFSVAKVLGLLLAASWLAAATAHRGRAQGLVAVNPMMAYLLGAFILYAALSLTWSEAPESGAGALGRYALNAVLLLIVVGTLHRRRDVVGLVTAYVVGATVSALYGIISVSEAADSDSVARVSGTIGDANELSAALVAGFALSAGLSLVAWPSAGLRAGAWAGAFVCLVGSFLSLSRGGFVALAVALAAAVVFGGRWRARVGWVALFVAVGVALYFALLASPQALERVTAVDGGTGRTDIWTIGWRMVQDQPILGVGVGNFQTASIHYLLEPGGIDRDEFIVDRPEVAHNTYLHVLAELGIVGLTAFVSIIFLSLRSALLAARTFGARGELDMELLARSVLIGLVGILVADFFISEQFSKLLWLLLGAGPALLAVAGRPDDADDERPPADAGRSRRERVVAAPAWRS